MPLRVSLLVYLAKTVISVPTVAAKDLKEPPNLGIAQVHSTQSSGWHWVALEDGHIFDGIWGDAYGIVNWPSHFRITSYLPIED
jgi:hypothetical protein